MDTRNNRPYKTFLERNLYTFYFRQCFTVSFKFSLIFVILVFSQLNGIYRSIRMKISWDFQSIFISMVEAFPSYKDVQSTMGQGQKHGYNHRDFRCTWPTISFLQCELVQTTATAFLSTWLALSRSAKTHQPVICKLSYKHDIL